MTVLKHDGFDLTRDDHADLTIQLVKIRHLMLASGGWWTLEEVWHETGIPETSVSARLRDLRKPKFGAFTVQKHLRRWGGAKRLWEYHVVSPTSGT